MAQEKKEDIQQLKAQEGLKEALQYEQSPMGKGTAVRETVETLKQRER